MTGYSVCVPGTCGQRTSGLLKAQNISITARHYGMLGCPQTAVIHLAEWYCILCIDIGRDWEFIVGSRNRPSAATRAHCIAATLLDTSLNNDLAILLTSSASSPTVRANHHLPFNILSFATFYNRL